MVQRVDCKYGLELLKGWTGTNGNTEDGVISISQQFVSKLQMDLFILPGSNYLGLSLPKIPLGSCD